VGVSPERRDWPGWAEWPACGRTRRGWNQLVDRAVAVNWDAYEIYNPGVSGPLWSVPRQEARLAYDRLMDAKPERIELLRRLLAANGIVLSTTDEGIQEVNHWFLAFVEGDPNDPGRLLPAWYSVVNDIALWIGEVIIERCPSVHWQFFTSGTKDVSYQRHTLMGFANVRSPGRLSTQAVSGPPKRENERENGQLTEDF
jgi:hypothetical protein